LKTLVKNTLNLDAFVSFSDPGIAPQGYVNDDAGGVTERAEYFRMSLVFTTRTGDPSIDPDPDVGVPLNSLSGAALSAWNTIQPSDQAVSYTYIHQRSLSLFCNNTYLLNNRSQFFTINDLMELMGPPGCTPGTSCNCWARVERTRCSSATAAPYISDEPLLSLQDSAGICKSYDDIPFWFSDSSPQLTITQQPATDFFLTSTLLNAEIRKICQTQLYASAGFYMWSSATAVDDQNLGGVKLIESNVDMCATYYAEMAYQSAPPNGPTQPYVFYSYANLATVQLFRNVSTIFEIQFGGQEDIDVSSVKAGFFPFSSDYGNVPPDVYDVEVNTMAFTGYDLLPVRGYVFQGIEQSATVTLTQVSGNPDQAPSAFFEQTFNLQRYDDPFLSASYPDFFYHVGYWDCLKLRCPNVYNPDVGPASFVYDLPANKLSGRVPIEIRKGKPDYVMQFSDTNDSLSYSPYPYNPFNNPKLMSAWGVDGLRQQENLTQFEPDGVSDSPHFYKEYIDVYLYKGTPQYRCNPNTTHPARMGAVCGLLQYWEVMSMDPLNILPEIDVSAQLKARPKLDQMSYVVTAVLEIPSANITFLGGPAVTRLECPNPQQISILTPSTYSAYLSVDNQHSYDIVVEIKTVPPAGANETLINCTQTNTQTIANFSTYQWNLPYCSFFTLQITAIVNGTIRQLCYSQDINTTAIALARNSVAYQGDLDLLTGLQNATLSQNNAIFSSAQGAASTIGKKALITTNLAQYVVLLSFQTLMTQLEDALTARRNSLLAGESPLVGPNASTLAQIAADMQVTLAQSQHLQTAILYAATSQFSVFQNQSAQSSNLTTQLEATRRMVLQQLAAITQENLAISAFLAQNPNGINGLSIDEQARLNAFIDVSETQRAQNNRLIQATERSDFPVSLDIYGNPNLPLRTDFNYTGDNFGGSFWDSLAGLAKPFNAIIDPIAKAVGDGIDLVKKLVDCGVKTLEGDIKACPCKFNISILCGFNWQLLLFILAGVLVGGAIIFILVMKFANTPFKVGSSEPSTSKTAKTTKKTKKTEEEEESEPLVEPKANSSKGRGCGRGRWRQYKKT
jgi:hypothetical protein